MRPRAGHQPVVDGREVQVEIVHLDGDQVRLT
jgi:sRNA-binding carbon storage regulator CsrA